MAYFPNGSAGECFDAQCLRCRYWERECPIYLVQHDYNSRACNNKVARAILDALVADDGTCSMFSLDPENFKDRRETDQPYIGEDRRGMTMAATRAQEFPTERAE